MSAGPLEPNMGMISIARGSFRVVVSRFCQNEAKAELVRNLITKLKTQAKAKRDGLPLPSPCCPVPVAQSLSPSPCRPVPVAQSLPPGILAALLPAKFCTVRGWCRQTHGPIGTLAKQLLHAALGGQVALGKAKYGWSPTALADPT